MDDFVQEGVLDYLKNLWKSIAGKPEATQQIDKISSVNPEDDDGYSGVEDIQIGDPKLRSKVAHLYIRGLRLYKEAELFQVADKELEAILVGVWSGKIPLSRFLSIIKDGTLERIYARIRERIRYQKHKRGMWYESKK
jgi:hypothetical protein